MKVRCPISSLAVQVGIVPYLIGGARARTLRPGRSTPFCSARGWWLPRSRPCTGRDRNGFAERRNQCPAKHHVKPKPEAPVPNRDMTRNNTMLPALTSALYLNLYVIRYLFSPYVFGCMVPSKENACLARHLFSEVLTQWRIVPIGLMVLQKPVRDSLLPSSLLLPYAV